MFNIKDLIKNSVNNLVRDNTEDALKQQVLQDVAIEQANQQAQQTAIDNRPSDVPKDYVRYKNTITKENSTSQGLQKQDVVGSGTKQNTQSISTDYDIAKANAEADAERERYKQLLQPYEEQQRAYFKTLNDVYNRYAPDKITPLQEDERLAGIQALATAIGNLGRAVGKSLGNDKGLGMVTIDDNQKFLNFYNKALSDHDRVRNAQAEEGLRKLNQQIELLRGKNDLNSKVMAQVIDAGEKARERALNGNKTITSNDNYNNTENTTKNTNSTTNNSTQSDTWIDPNSLTTKRDKATISSARSSSRSNSSESSRSGKNGKTYYIRNPYFRAGGQNSKGWAVAQNGKFSDDFTHFMAQGNIEVTDEMVGNYYTALREVMKKYLTSTDKYGNEIKWKEPSDMDTNAMVSEINRLCQSLWSGRKDADKMFKDIDTALNKVNFKSDMGL